MDMPKPGAEHAALKAFEGTWHGVETMPPSPWAPQTTRADGQIVNRPALGGFSVVQDYVQTQGGIATYQGHGVFTWDGKSGEYLLYWFDSMGSPVDHFRGKRSGQVWTFVSTNERGMTRSIWDFTSPTAYRHKMEVSPDGKAWNTFMDGDYKKVSG